MSSSTFTQADGSSRTILGYHYVPPPDTVKHYDPTGFDPADLPSVVDLRRYMTPVENQKATSSCTGNAVAGAYEYLVKRHLGQACYDVSRLFVYYNGRRIEKREGPAEQQDTPVEDGGSNLWAVIQGLVEHGACSEETWAFDEAQVNEQPSDEAYSEAREFLVEDTESLENDLAAWKTALAQGHPIIFAVHLYNSFDQWQRHGHVPAPTPREAAGENYKGGHAMLCVGYSDRFQAFLVRNSWGPEWGLGGYCYMPYGYLMDERFSFKDNWIIERLDVLEPDTEGCWFDEGHDDDDDHDGSGGSDHVSGFLQGLDPDQWADLIDRMGSIPLGVRLALLFLHAASADGDVAPEETTAAVEHLGPVLEQLGSRLDAQTLVDNTLPRLGSDDRGLGEDAVEESVRVFGEVFSHEVLTSIAAQLQDIVASDGYSEAEQAFVDHVAERWQVETRVADGAGEAAAEDEGEVEEGGEAEEGEEEGEAEAEDFQEEGEAEDEEAHWSQNEE